MATPDYGGFAEAVVTRAGNVVRLPDSIDYATAAGFAIAYGTAYGALCWAGRVQPGGLRATAVHRRRRTRPARPGPGRHLPAFAPATPSFRFRPP